MKHKRPLGVLAIALATLLPMANTTMAQTTKPVLLEELAQMPSTRDVIISPDGKHLAMVFRTQNEYRLAILDTATRKPKGAYRVWGKGNEIARVTWVNNERLVYTMNVSSTWNKDKIEIDRLIGLNVDGGRHNNIFVLGKAGVAGQQIIDILPDEPNHVLLAVYPNRAATTSSPTIQRLQVYNKKLKKISSLPLPLSDALVDHNHDVRFSIGPGKDGLQEVYYRANRDADWQQWSFKRLGLYNAQPLAFTKDNNSVYMLADEGKTNALYKLALGSDKPEKLYHDPQVDITEVVYDWDDKGLVAVGVDKGEIDYFYVDESNEKGKQLRRLKATFPGKNVYIASQTRDASKLIALVYSDKDAGSYYLYDMKKPALDWIADRRPWVNPEQMSAKTPIEVTTRDGQTLHGYLTKPKGKDKDLPMIVMPHGGPKARDYWEFEWETQLLASKGYAVLQVNYRGSTGYGVDFEYDGHHKWGTLMQDDVTDATKAMIEQGVADSKRICMYGFSFGAYSALMGAVREPDLYKCVAGGGGVYSLPLLWDEGLTRKTRWGKSFLARVVGDEDNEADLKKRSPAYNADKIKAAVLLYHGKQDNRAPIEHAEAMIAGMDKAGVNYEWMEFTDEAHGYDDQQNRVKIFKRLLSFFDKHIGDK